MRRGRKKGTNKREQTHKSNKDRVRDLDVAKSENLVSEAAALVTSSWFGRHSSRRVLDAVTPTGSWPVARSAPVEGTRGEPAHGSGSRQRSLILMCLATTGCLRSSVLSPVPGQASTPFPGDPAGRRGRPVLRAPPVLLHLLVLLPGHMAWGQGRVLCTLQPQLPVSAWRPASAQNTPAE